MADWLLVLVSEHRQIELPGNDFQAKQVIGISHSLMMLSGGGHLP